PLVEETPNADFWSAAGADEGYGYSGGRGKYDESDLLRRARLVGGVGEMCYTLTESHPEEVVWVAEVGTPGVELGFDVDLDGVRVRGYIDQVLTAASDDSVRVRDVKTGAQPGDALQLKVYAVALEDTYGVQAPTGDYWMAKSGK